MQDQRLNNRIARAVAAAAAAVAVLVCLPSASLGDLHHQLSSQHQAASQLNTQIAAETQRIAATSAGVRQAEGRLASLQAQAGARQAQLVSVQRRLVAARNRLTRLVNRYHDAADALAANLRAAYEDPAPDIVTVIVDAHGFNDLLEQLRFLQKVQRQNATILHDTKTARTQVLHQTVSLARLQDRNRALTAAVLRARDQAAAVQAALLTRQAVQLQQRASTSAKLAAVRGQIASIRSRIAHIARVAAQQTQRQAAVHPVAGLPLDPGGMAQAPAGAPAAVKQVIAAGNAIAGLPYLYGGGHGSFHANAYDCSGSVSYALAAAGLVSSPLDSTAFESWGQAGAGRWITVYANAGHAFMVVAGWRFDTGALSAGGTRWSRSMRSTAGFVARHPAGL